MVTYFPRLLHSLIELTLHSSGPVAGMAGMRFIQSQARVELLNQLNGEKVFGITWMADRYDTEKYKRRSRGAGVMREGRLGWIPSGNLT